jgi:hypothetical protein
MEANFSSVTTCYHILDDSNLKTLCFFTGVACVLVWHFAVFIIECQRVSKKIFADFGGRRPVGKPRGRWEDAVGWMQ